MVEAVTAWVWWGRGGVKWLRAGDSSEKYERNCLTWRCQNSSDLGMRDVLSTPSTPTSFSFHSLIFFWCLQQKFSGEAEGHSDSRGVIPWEAPWEGRRTDLSWQIINTDTYHTLLMSAWYWRVIIELFTSEKNSAKDSLIFNIIRRDFITEVTRNNLF